MNLRELKTVLSSNPEAPVRFRLPDRSLVAPHAHITEVGLVTKCFVDCGGTTRSESKCLLQSWVADDLEHRLSADKLLSIIEKGSRVLLTDDLPVELEHDVGFATQFQLVAAKVLGSELILEVTGRHTACLAPEKCCPPAQETEVVSLGRKRTTRQ